MSGVEVRVPTATAQLQGVEAKVDVVTAHFGINGFPSVSVNFHDGNLPDSGVIKMAGTDVAASVAAQQNAMFTSQLPNSSIEITDGAGGTLSFSGYISGPKYSLGVGQVGFQTTIVHEASALSNLKTNIYQNINGAYRNGKSVLEADIGASLWASLEKLRKYSTLAARALPDGESRTISEQIDASNAKGLAIWEQICSQSEVEWPELPALIEKNSTTGVNISAVIYGAYLSNYNDFVQTMQQLQAMFSMVYVPSLENGNAGKFISTDVAVGDATPLTVKLRAISMTAGPKNIMPLAYVAVRGPAPKEWRRGRYGHIVRRWPKVPVSTGQVVEIGPPSWLPTDQVVGLPQGATLTDTMSLAGYRISKRDEKARLYEVNFPAVGKLLDRWAKQHYMDFSLAPTSAQVTTDLNLGVVPGTRYAVSSANGPLFKGFLTGVEHSVSSKPNQLQAYTRLSFSHIEAIGFTLPFKD